MKLKGLIITIIVAIVLSRGIYLAIEDETVIAETVNLESMEGIKNVPKNVLNKVLDVPADISIKTYDYFRSAVDTETMKVSDEIWGTMAKLSGNGNSFEDLVRGITESIKGKL